MPAAAIHRSPARRRRRAGIWTLSWSLPLVRYLDDQDLVFRIRRRRGSARRSQLTFDGLRVVRETLGDTARHVPDIDLLLAGLESIEDLGGRRGRRHFRDRQHR